MLMKGMKGKEKEKRERKKKRKKVEREPGNPHKTNSNWGPLGGEGCGNQYGRLKRGKKGRKKKG